MADMAETNWDENIKARLARPSKERRSSERYEICLLVLP